jgi:hypothetical protein
MHGDVTLGGPVFWFMVAMLFLAGMLSAFVSLDSARRLLLLKPDPTRWLWAYLLPQAAFFVLLIVGQIPSVPFRVTGIVVLMTPFALIQQVVFLLRVVFPKPPAEELDVEGVEVLADGGDTIEPGSEPEHREAEVESA